DPRREFRLRLADPLERSSIFTLAIVAILGLAMLALIEPPTPAMKTAMHLRELAKRLEASGSADDRDLATAVTKAAEDLINPKLPPEKKREDLDIAMKLLAMREKKAGEEKAGAQKGSGSGNGSAASAEASGEAKGEGQGKGQGSGSGQGTDKGPGGQKSGKQQAGEKGGEKE